MWGWVAFGRTDVRGSPAMLRVCLGLVDISLTVVQLADTRSVENGSLVRQPVVLRTENSRSLAPTIS